MMITTATSNNSNVNIASILIRIAPPQTHGGGPHSKLRASTPRVLCTRSIVFFSWRSMLLEKLARCPPEPKPNPGVTLPEQRAWFFSSSKPVGSVVSLASSLGQTVLRAASQDEVYRALQVYPVSDRDVDRRDAFSCAHHLADDLSAVDQVFGAPSL